MPLDLPEYRKCAKLAPEKWDPDPFQPHTDGPWHDKNFEAVVEGVLSLLKRFRAGEITEKQLLKGKDNGPDRQNTLKFWLYYQHHPRSEYWKLMGQRYWSVEAWRAWREAGGRKFPKRRYRDRGLVSEHVVPKNVLKSVLMDCNPTDRATIQSWLKRNLCCVVTKAEDGKLESARHPDPTDPWKRYGGKQIVLIHNQCWKDAEIKPLLRHGLLSCKLSVDPS